MALVFIILSKQNCKKKAVSMKKAYMYNDKKKKRYKMVMNNLSIYICPEMQCNLQRRVCLSISLTIINIIHSIFFHCQRFSTSRGLVHYYYLYGVNI